MYPLANPYLEDSEEEQLFIKASKTTESQEQLFIEETETTESQEQLFIEVSETIKNQEQQETWKFGLPVGKNI